MDSYAEKMSRTFLPALLGTFVCFSLIGGIILGSYGTSIYIKGQNDENLFRPWETTCLLLDYQYVKHNCQSCGGDGCTTYICYNQIYEINYRIFNGSYINSTIIISNKQDKHTMKIGENYTCYYDEPHDVTFVKWEYKDKKLGLILLSIGYSIVGIDMIIIIFIILYKLIRKFYRKWMNKPQDIFIQLHHIQEEQY